VHPAPIEAEFVNGLFALPHAARRPKEAVGGDGRETLRASEDEVEAELEDAESGSSWSGTQRPRMAGVAPPTNFLLARPDGEMPDVDAGVVGGTIVIRGVSGEEERMGIVRALSNLVS
jgi:hypothetical protein